MTRFCSTRRPTPQRTADAGFTLVEVAVAIALLSLVMTGVYGIFTAVSSTEKQLTADAEGYHQGRVIFDRIGRELSGSYLALNNELSAFSAGHDSQGDPYLAFTSTSALTHGDAPGGLVRVRYALKSELGQKNARLLRSAVPLFVPDEAERQQRLTSQVARLQWRFYDGSSWQEEWDSTTNGALPRTVEMALTLRSGEREIQLLTAFDLAQPRIVQ